MEPDAFLRPSEVLRLTGVSKSTLYEWIAKGRFPKPIKLSKTIAVWPAREISDWQQRVGRKA